MTIIQRCRVWLQKPWFVAVLSIVAVLYSLRNIVLPLIDMGSHQAEVTPVAGGDLLLSADQESGVGQSDTVDLVAERLRLLAAGSYQRNPFLMANDPRQPGFSESQNHTALIAPKRKLPTLERDTINVGQLFRLSALLRRDGQAAALINRQVVKLGQSVRPSDEWLDQSNISSAQKSQLKTLLEGDYFLSAVTDSGVIISGGMDQYEIALQR